MEIEAILGPGRPASSLQRERLNDVAGKMPKDTAATLPAATTDLGWGNKEAWLAARFTADNRSIIVTWQYGNGPPPTAPPAPKVYFRDFSKDKR